MAGALAAWMQWRSPVNSQSGKAKWGRLISCPAHFTAIGGTPASNKEVSENTTAAAHLTPTPHPLSQDPLFVNSNFMTCLRPGGCLPERQAHRSVQPWTSSSKATAATACEAEALSALILVRRAWRRSASPIGCRLLTPTMPGTRRSPQGPPGGLAASHARRRGGARRCLPSETETVSSPNLMCLVCKRRKGFVGLSVLVNQQSYLEDHEMSVQGC